MKEMTLREIQLREIDALVWLSNFCEKENIKLCLSGGTLLGAIRHKGFIPWDDDIDIMIPRNEYDILIGKLELEDDPKYKVISMNNDGTPLPFSKLIDKTVVLKHKQNRINANNNLWIDIFPVDGFPSNCLSIRMFCIIALILRKASAIAHSEEIFTGNILHDFLRALVWLPIKRYGAPKLLHAIYNHCTKYPVNSSNNIGVVFLGLIRECMPKDQWLKYDKVIFEDKTYYAPGCWDYYLKSLYGDYMKLPPENKRHLHYFKAYTNEV